MMALFKYVGLLVVLVLPKSTFAAKPLGREICVAACYDALQHLEFIDQPGGNGTSCLNDLRVSSTFDCVRSRCDSQDIAPGISWWQKQCKHSSSAVSVARYHSAADNLSVEFLSSLHTFEYGDKSVLNEIVLPSNETWNLVYGTVVGLTLLLYYTGAYLHLCLRQSAYSLQRHLDHTFRWIQYAFWALVLVVVTGYRLVELIYTALCLSDSAFEEDGNTKWKARPRAFTTCSSIWRNQIVLAPTLGRRIQRTLGWLTGGTRLQAITILCYIIIHIAIVSVRYPTMEENIYYKSREAQRLRYVSDRLGVLMSSSLPFIWLFGTRNNFFLWATGLSFSTMQIFHRWVAIVFSIEAIIHGSCFTAYYFERKVRSSCAKDHD